MRATVITPFADKNDTKLRIYEAGETFEGTAARVRELESLGKVKGERKAKPKGAGQ